MPVGRIWRLVMGERDTHGYIEKEIPRLEGRRCVGCRFWVRSDADRGSGTCVAPLPLWVFKLRCLKKSSDVTTYDYGMGCGCFEPEKE